MADQNRPKPQVIVQTPDVRVAEFALAAGDGQPWHRHSRIADTFYGLEGLTEIENSRAGTATDPAARGKIQRAAGHRASRAQCTRFRKPLSTDPGRREVRLYRDEVGCYGALATR